MLAILSMPSIDSLNPTMASSSGRHHGRWQEAEQHSVGSLTRVLACLVKPYRWDMQLHTLGRALGGNWTGFTAVRPKADCIPHELPDLAQGDM